MSNDFNLISFYKKFASEQDCINYLEKTRWGDTITCPRCHSEKTYKFTTRSIYKCKACQKQFTVRIGTIFEESRLPLQKWFLAVYLATSLKKGVSSVQLSKYLDITQKSAWFMLQRIRYALENGGFDDMLGGTVEIDETYVGGKHKGKRGRGSENKTPVIGMVERDGKLITQVVDDTKTRTIKPLVRENIKIGSNIVTDEYRSYGFLSKNGYLHSVVNHSLGEYVVMDSHTNTIEGFWSHLKRGITGVYIHVSKKHLSKYCKEFEYRHNTRELNDGERFLNWFTYSENTRLTYERLVASV